MGLWPSWWGYIAWIIPSSDSYFTIAIFSDDFTVLVISHPSATDIFDFATLNWSLMIINGYVVFQPIIWYPSNTITCHTASTCIWNHISLMFIGSHRFSLRPILRWVFGKLPPFLAVKPSIFLQASAAKTMTSAAFECSDLEPGTEPGTYWPAYLPAYSWDGVFGMGNGDLWDLICIYIYTYLCSHKSCMLYYTYHIHVQLWSFLCIYTLYFYLCWSIGQLLCFSRKGMNARFN